MTLFRAVPFESSLTGICVFENKTRPFGLGVVHVVLLGNAKKPHNVVVEHQWLVGEDPYFEEYASQSPL